MASASGTSGGSPRAAQATVNLQDCRFVYFDLETTGLPLDSHITQIGAITGQNEFSRYVLPRKAIHPKAAEVSGITCDGQQMYKNGVPVTSLRITQALDEFINILAQWGVPGRVVLVGHNAKNFDCPILLNALTACGMVPRFNTVVHGFADTFPLFQEIGVGSEWPSLKFLYERYVGGDFPAHDAAEDAKALQLVAINAGLDPAHFSRHFFTFEEIDVM